MDAKTRDIALISDHLVFGFFFFVAGGVAAMDIAMDQWG
jgi:hypothetical protein